MVKLTLPYPPSINAYWGYKGSQRYIKKEGVAFRTSVMWICKGQPKLTGRLKIRITLHAPDKRRRDVDNPIKSLLDALVKGEVLEDDSQIDDLHIMRGKPVAGGSVDIELLNIN